MRRHAKASSAGSTSGRGIRLAVSLCMLLALAVVPAGAAAAAPSILEQSVASVGRETARLYTQVNPRGLNTNYYYEYGPSSAYGTQAPSAELFAGNGNEAVVSSLKLTGLQPGATYHYRVVARNSSGTTTGADQTFTTASDPASCPNAALRAEQVSTALPEGPAYLPDCMALEMATPPQKSQQPVKEASLSADGNQVLFRTAAALAGTEAVVELRGDLYVAERVGAGWETTPTMLHKLAGLGQAIGFGPDFRSWFQVFPETTLQATQGTTQVFRDRIDRSSTPFSPQLITVDAPGPLDLIVADRFQGASADGSQFFFAANGPNVGGGAPATRFSIADPTPGPEATARANVYIASLGEDGEPAPLRLLARDSSGKAWGGNCGARVGGDADLSLQQGSQTQRVRNQGAVSADGSRVYFSARASQPATGPCDVAHKMRILERLETPAGPQIAELIQSECSRVSPPCDTSDGNDGYQGASADGSKVYFTTTRQLADSDLDAGASCEAVPGASAGCDLYLYDAELPPGDRLIQVSAGDATNPTPGAGAKVLNGIAAISTDGSHAYFVAEGVLTAVPNKLGVGAVAGQLNLYAYERDAANPGGRIAFVGAVGPGDSRALWGGAVTFENAAYPVPALGQDDQGEEVGGDGHVLFFRSVAPLAANDVDGGMRDAYRYDSEAGSLQCVSCLPERDTGAFGVVGIGVGDQIPPGADLTSRDRWASEDGRTAVFATSNALLPGESAGTEHHYLWRDGQLLSLPGGAPFVDDPTVSGDGSSVAFRTADALLPGDGDTATDVYVARIGGGFPVPPTVDICTAEACQEPFTAQPAAQGPAASESAGAGNVRERPKCRKGFARRNGKCLKRPKQARKRHANRNRHANKNRRAAR